MLRFENIALTMILCIELEHRCILRKEYDNVKAMSDHWDCTKVYLFQRGTKVYLFERCIK